MYFHPFLYWMASVTNITKDPWADFLPFVIKYGSLQSIKPYFDERFKHLRWWERTYQWIELFCNAAETMAPINEKKSQAYLKEAQNICGDLWAFPFWINRAAVAAQKQQAQLRIKETQARLSKS